MPVYDPSLRSAPTVGESGQSSNTRLLGSPGVHSPHGISVVSAVLVQLAIVTKRQTHTHRERPRYNGNSGPHRMPTHSDAA